MDTLEKIHFQAEVAATDLIRNAPLEVEVGGQKYSFTPNDNALFANFKGLHSLPVVNGNGMCFSLNVLKKAWYGAVNAPLTYEHMLEGNPLESYDPDDDGNHIMGWTALAYLDDLADEIDEAFPDDPVAAYLVGAFFKRIETVRKVINEHASEQKTWKTSYEVLRNSKEDAYVDLASKTFHPVADAPKDLADAWKQGQYDKVGRAIGGENGDSVRFWGHGVTDHPADPDADFMALAASKNFQTGEAVVKQQKIQTQIPFDFQKSEIAATQVSIQTDGTFGGTKLIIGNQEIANFDSVHFSAYSHEEHDDMEPEVYLNFSFRERFGDFEARKTYQMRPEEGGMAFEISEKEQEFAMDAKMLKKILSASEELFSEMAKERGYIKKDSEEFTDALEAARKEEREKYAEHVSPDELDTKVAEQAEVLFKAKMDEEKAVQQRIAEMEDDGIVVNEAREKDIRDLDTDADDEFASLKKQWESEQAKMRKDLKESKITVGEQLDAELAQYTGTDDPGYKAMKRTLLLGNKQNGGGVSTDFDAIVGSGDGDDELSPEYY